METHRIIEYDKAFTDCVKEYRTVVFEADVENSETSDQQKKELNDLTQEISRNFKVEEINSISGIASTRKAYKACGKDPNRYRPSQEQLMRRIVRGLGLYNVNALVDAGNEFSIRTGCSVGCFDADKIVGDIVTLGVGRKDEPYNGIGRGVLNIEGMPVFRDGEGGIGTPTSDNERTKLSLDTRHIFVTVHLFDPTIDSEEIKQLFYKIFGLWGNAKNVRSTVFKPDASHGTKKC